MVPQLSFILTEAALETIPDTLQKHPATINYAKKIGRPVYEILLDKSYHYSSMRDKKIDMIWKRGRPDIVHLCLMSVLSTPLFLNNLVTVYIHTVNDAVIFIGEQVRLPKSYERFEGLMIKLFRDKKIKDEIDDRVLLRIEKSVTFGRLVDEYIRPSRIIGLSSTGIFKHLKTIIDDNMDHKSKEKIAFVVGGFQSGDFSHEIRERFHMTYSISKEKLEAHVVLARLAYECEKLLNE